MRRSSRLRKPPARGKSVKDPCRAEFVGWGEQCLACQRPRLSSVPSMSLVRRSRGDHSVVDISAIQPPDASTNCHSSTSPVRKPDSGAPVLQAPRPAVLLMHRSSVAKPPRISGRRSEAAPARKDLAATRKPLPPGTTRRRRRARQASRRHRTVPCRRLRSTAR